MPASRYFYSSGPRLWPIDKSDIRKPYYDQYVTNGKMVWTVHARKIFVTFIMLWFLCRHLRCRHNSDKTQPCHSLVTGDKTLSLLCHPCWWVVIEAQIKIYKFTHFRAGTTTNSVKNSMECHGGNLYLNLLFFTSFSAKVNQLSHSSAVQYFNKNGKVFHPLVLFQHFNE